MFKLATTAIVALTLLGASGISTSANSHHLHSIHAIYVNRKHIRKSHRNKRYHNRRNKKARRRKARRVYHHKNRVKKHTHKAENNLVKFISSFYQARGSFTVKPRTLRSERRVIHQLGTNNKIYSYEHFNLVGRKDNKNSIQYLVTHIDRSGTPHYAYIQVKHSIINKPNKNFLTYRHRNYKFNQINKKNKHVRRNRGIIVYRHK